MNTDQFDLAYAYALDTADLRELNAVDSLRSGGMRGEFDAVVRQTREMLAALAITTGLRPPPELRDRVVAAVTAERGADVVPLATAKSRPRQWLLGGVGVAAAAALLFGGVAIGSQFRQAPVSVTGTVFGASDSRATSVSVTGGGSATVVYSRTADRAIMFLADVPKPKPGLVYQAWVLRGSERPVSAGIVQTEAFAPIVDLGGATTVALTVEPTGGSEQPTANPIAAVALG